MSKLSNYSEVISLEASRLFWLYKILCFSGKSWISNSRVGDYVFTSYRANPSPNIIKTIGIASSMSNAPNCHLD